MWQNTRTGIWHHKAMLFCHFLLFAGVVRILHHRPLAYVGGATMHSSTARWFLTVFLSLLYLVRSGRGPQIMERVTAMHSSHYRNHQHFIRIVAIRCLIMRRSAYLARI